MNKAKQRAFVRGLAKNVVAGVLKESDRWPEDWDGHELRALLADAFTDANCGLCAKRAGRVYQRSPMERRRRADYEHEKYARNIR